MISDYSILRKQFLENKLAGSYGIFTKNLNAALEELNKILIKFVFENNPSLMGNPDYLVIHNSQEIKSQNGRELKEFFLTKPLIYSKKIAIITPSDNMNIYAANACLKILEEPPKFGHIFLIYKNPSKILATIKSRCHKITHLKNNDSAKKYENIEDNSYKNFLIDIADGKNFIQKYLKILKSSPNSEDIGMIFNNFLLLIGRICKYQFGACIELAETEQKIATKFSKFSKSDMLKKYDSINELICNQSAFNLDPKRSFLILLNEIRDLI